MHETLVYQESQRMRFGLALILGSSMAIFCAIFFSIKEPWGVYLAVGVALLVAVLTSLTTRMDTLITPTQLQFGMPIYRKTFALAQVQVGEIEKISLVAGLGIHYFRGRWVYNAHFGRGVSLVANGTKYLLGSEEPERLLAALQQAATNRVKP